MHRHHENEYEMYLRDCNWLSMFFSHRGRKRERREIKSMSKCVCVCNLCVCYLEVLHERPRVLDSVVFLQMEHPQIQQRQTAVTMETKPLEGR